MLATKMDILDVEILRKRGKISTLLRLAGERRIQVPDEAKVFADRASRLRREVRGLERAREIFSS